MSTEPHVIDHEAEVAAVTFDEARRDEILCRYHALVKKEWPRGLTEDEKAEMEALNREIDRFPDRFCEPLLVELVELVNRERIIQARSLVRALARRWPNQERIRHLNEVLAPPEVRVLHGVTLPLHLREREWLKEHAHEHPGCWLAVLDDRLIVADPDLGVVEATLRQTPEGERALLDFQMKRSE